MSKIEAIRRVSDFLIAGNVRMAKEVIKKDYPFVPVKRYVRTYTIRQMAEQFYRDGFIDRYSGEKLVNPGMLRVMSEKIPVEFPYQAHWKTDECHMAYWDYQPTIDHIIPVALGGTDTPENWVSTSMANNSAKSNFTLERIGWALKPAGSIKEWDGLSERFIHIVEADTDLLRIKRIKDWYVATKEQAQKISKF